MLPPYTLEQTIEKIVREEWGRILSSITKTLGDLQLAEDSLQDAVEAALKDWAKKGLPKSPSAWLDYHGAPQAIDRIRRANLFERKQAELAQLLALDNQSAELPDLDPITDERLEMIFTCCHPALAEKTRIALTLRTIGGLTTDEIASAFLDAPSAMAQRIVRAKQKIKLAGIPYEVPGTDALPIRIRGVLGVLYLIFNEGYAATSGSELTRVDLIHEAIRLARIVTHLLPEEAEASGLLALMLLHDARRLARLDEHGRMVSLEQQNRKLWDKAKIDEGTRMLKSALLEQRLGPYQIQACISALHVEAASWNETDWPQIAALYNLLFEMQPSPIVRINQALALSYAETVDRALLLLDEVAASHDTSALKPYHVARADLLERQGDHLQAVGFYKRAIELSDNETERAFLMAKI